MLVLLKAGAKSPSPVVPYTRKSWLQSFPVGSPSRFPAPASPHPERGFLFGFGVSIALGDDRGEETTAATRPALCIASNVACESLIGSI